ncbi:MAG: hypothetical protein QXL96_07315 [Ignisphaera sp.]
MTKLVAHEVTDIYRGDTIFMNIPEGSEIHYEVLIPLVDIVAKNKMKTLVVTYNRYSQYEIIEVFTSIAQELGLDKEIAIKALGKYAS